jgi:TonB family protein
MAMLALSALLLFQSVPGAGASEAAAPFAAEQCPALALGPASLTAIDLSSWRGPTLNLRIALTAEEARVLGRRGVVQLGARPYFAGSAYVRYPDGYFANPPEVVAARGETPVLELSFEREALPDLTRGGTVKFTDDKGSAIARTLAPADGKAFGECVARYAANANPNIEMKFRHSATFIPLLPDQPVTLRNRGSISDFYPITALREERSGTAMIQMTIGANGMVSSCAVIASSGHADLDAASCRMTRFMRFLPKTDAAGNAEEATVKQQIIWQIPRD